MVCNFLFLSVRRLGHNLYFEASRDLFLLLFSFFESTRSHVRMLIEVSRLDLPETSRSGPPPEGAENGSDRPGALWEPKPPRNDRSLNRNTDRIWPPPEPAISAPRSGPPGTSDSDLPTDPLEELPVGLESSVVGVRRSV